MFNKKKINKEKKKTEEFFSKVEEYLNTSSGNKYLHKIIDTHINNFFLKNNIVLVYNIHNNKISKDIIMTQKTKTQTPTKPLPKPLVNEIEKSKSFDINTRLEISFSPKNDNIITIHLRNGKIYNKLSLDIEGAIKISKNGSKCVEINHEQGNIIVKKGELQINDSLSDESSDEEEEREIEKH